MTIRLLGGGLLLFAQPPLFWFCHIAQQLVKKQRLVNKKNPGDDNKVEIEKTPTYMYVDYNTETNFQGLKLHNEQVQ